MEYKGIFYKMFILFGYYKKLNIIWYKTSLKVLQLPAKLLRHYHLTSTSV